MKYRRLSSDELKELEPQFIRFLASNSITADDWVTLKTANIEKANGLIDIFSDIVFEQTLEKIEYLEYKTPKDIKLFHCLEDKILMMGMMVDEQTTIDFTQNKTPQEMMDILHKAEADLKIYSAEKPYKPNRKAELFKMMENGCLIANGMLFKTLEDLKPKN